MGLDVLPISNGGRSVEIFQTGSDYLHGDVDRDEREVAGIKELGVRSSIGTPLVVGTERRGALQAASLRRNAFDQEDLQFLRGVARWIGTIAHRAELDERATRIAMEEGRRLAAEELVTVLAHDLGNYLTPLRGRLELCLRLARREDRKDDGERLEAAITNVDAITSLTRDLLDVSRLEEGMLHLEPSLIDIRSLFNSVARAMATDKVSIDIDVPEGLAAPGDHARIRQVLTNLLGNAVHHSPKGSTIRLVAASGVDAVELRVEDQGPGVPTDLMPRVFTRYARGPRSTGLGLGLYLAERIAAAHGGALTLESSPSGAIFTLRLPIRPTAASASATEEIAAASSVIS
jgi:two-component system OmpR family sensor kinase